MTDHNIFGVKRIIRDLLGDKYQDALIEPKQTLQDIPYENLSLMLQKIPLHTYESLSKDIDKDNQLVFDVLASANDILNQISSKMSVFSDDKLSKRADGYFKELGLSPETDSGSRDLSDLKRIIRGERGNYFDLGKPAKHFLIGDILERYFDFCLEEFKKTRDEEFSDLLAQKGKAA